MMQHLVWSNQEHKFRRSSIRHLAFFGVCFKAAIFMSSTNSRAAAFSASGSPEAPKGALIFLHGLGDTPAGWSSLQNLLPTLRPRLKDIKYVFPAAPMVRISINGGASMPGWFDLYDWPIGLCAAEDKDGTASSVNQIQKIVRELEQQEGIPRGNIVIGGFSQGGAIALLSAYGYPTQDAAEGSTAPFAGCAVLSGWLTPKEKWSIPGNAAERTPLFWAHGKYDDKVLFEQQEYGVDKLKDMGVKDILEKQYVMGHSSDPEELEELAKFVDAVLFESREA